MVRVSSEKSRVTGASGTDAEVILLVGTPQFANLTLDQFERFALMPNKISTRSVHALSTDRDFEKQVPPAVMIMGLDDAAPQTLRLARLHWPQTQIIVSASQHQMQDVYELLAEGAHDVVAGPQDLADKCMVRLGVHRAKTTNHLRNLGKLTVNLMQRTVTNGSDSVSLTPIEIKIVATLAESVGGVVQREAMKQLCWGDMEITDNALNRKIYEVRRTLRKLSEDVNIRTIYGLGFELTVRADQQV